VPEFVPKVAEVAPKVAEVAPKVAEVAPKVAEVAPKVAEVAEAAEDAEVADAAPEVVEFSSVFTQRRCHERPQSTQAPPSLAELKAQVAQDAKIQQDQLEEAAAHCVSKIIASRYEQHLRFRPDRHSVDNPPTSVMKVTLPHRFASSNRSTLGVLSSGPARKEIAHLIGDTMDSKGKGFTVSVKQDHEDPRTLRVELRKLVDKSTAKVAPEKAAAPVRAYAGGAAERERAQAKAQGK
jgi:hypothetical protein